MHGTILAALASLALLAALPGQTRISLPGGKRTELEQHCLRLGQPESRAAAIAALLQAGAPAVPLLLAAARKDDAGSLAAVRVLAELGPQARPARPALLRLAGGDPALARAAAAAAAAIGERDSIVVSDWSGNRVVELDPEGRLLREVKVDNPWHVQPVAGDRLLICSYNTQRLIEITWAGEEVASLAFDCGPIRAHRLHDGTTIVSLYNNAKVRCIDAAGAQLWELPFRARSFGRLLDDHLLLLDDHGKKLREVSPQGKVVRELAVHDNALGLERLDDGKARVVYADRIETLQADGTSLAVDAFGGLDARRLGDGRTVVGENGAVVLRDAKGEVLWRFACQYASTVVPRIEPTHGHR